jgi:hypothetical protein
MGSAEAADISAYSRKALPGGPADTPASVTVTPPLVNEKMTRPDGVVLPVEGATRTDPVLIVVAGPDTCSFTDIRAEIE